MLFWSQVIQLLFVTICLVRPIPGVVDCTTACQRCQLNVEHPRLLEVYCSMCQECTAHKREQKLRRSDGQQIINTLEDIPEGCPLPPPCDPDPDDLPPPPQYHPDCPPPPPCEPELDYQSYTLAQTRPTAPSSTTQRTTTTTQRTCPPSPPCKRRRPYLPCYYPCMPMCPCPYPQHTTISSKLEQKVDTSTTETTGSLYVYVGVPKDILEKADS